MNRRKFFAGLAALPFVPKMLEGITQETVFLPIEMVEYPGTVTPELEEMIHGLDALEEAMQIQARQNVIADAMALDREIMGQEFITTKYE